MTNQFVLIQHIPKLSHRVREKEAPTLIANAEELERKAEAVDFSSGEEIELVNQYYQMDQQLFVTRQNIARTVRKPDYILKFLQSPGRFLDITIDGDEYGWGVLVSCKKKQGTGSAGEAARLAANSGGSEYTLDVLLNCVDRHFDQTDNIGQDEDVDDLGLLWRGSSRDFRPATKDDPQRL